MRTEKKTNGKLFAENLVCSAAASHLKKFQEIAGGFEERGILHSEMLAMCAVCDDLGVQVILESGRARGQSTWMLAKYFSQQPLKIVSIDWREAEWFSEADDRFALKRLGAFNQVRILYGNSLVLLPRLLKEFSGKRIGVLLDGPKGEEAIDLLKHLIRQSPDIAAAFIHDTGKDFDYRRELETGFDRIFFTDEPKYAAAYSKIDEQCRPAAETPITQHTWRPYMKGNDPTLSYGPTLAIIFPKPSDAAISYSRWPKKMARTLYARARALWPI